MSTTFIITNKKYPWIVLSYDVKSEPDYYQFFRAGEGGYQVISYKGQQAIYPAWGGEDEPGGVVWSPINATPIWTSSEPDPPQEWQILPVGLNEPGFYLLANLGFGGYLAVPEHVVNAGDKSPPLEIAHTPSSDSEHWSLVNTASPAPQIQFAGFLGDPTGNTAGTIQIAGSGFVQKVGAKITLVTMGLPALANQPGAYVAASGFEVASDGSFSGQFDIPQSYVVSGPKPFDQCITVAAEDEARYVCALTAITADYWYSGVYDG